MRAQPVLELVGEPLLVVTFLVSAARSRASASVSTEVMRVTRAAYYALHDAQIDLKLQYPRRALLLLLLLASTSTASPSSCLAPFLLLSSSSQPQPQQPQQRRWRWLMVDPSGMHMGTYLRSAEGPHPSPSAP